MISMKKILGILLLTGTLGRLQAQIVSFNFSAGSHTATGWVNVAGDPSTAVRTATDPTSGISISSVATGNWVQSSGSCAADGSGAWPGTFFPYMMSNDWFQGNGSGRNLALYNALMPQLMISGLNADSTYILRMTGSNDYFSGTTQYTLAGAVVYNSQSVNVFYNTGQGVTFQQIAPDSTGTIRVYVNPTSSSDLGAICGIQVFPGSATVGIPRVTISSPATGTLVPEGGSVVIKATVVESGGTIAKVEYYADTTKIGEVDTVPYNFTWANPDPGAYQLTVKATDNTGTINSASVNIVVESLNYFWSTTGNIATGGDSSFIGTVDSNRLAIRTKNIERMSILPTGNIGIGTITPTAQLHTTGTVRLAGLTSDSTKTRVLVSDTSGNLFYRNVSSLSGRWQYASGTQYDSVDNIAIGTSNPQGYKLAVNGTAIFTKVRVKPQSNWPDYVFKKGYLLPDLTDLEQYIAQYHHLPGMVPAADEEREGYDLGEQQSTLLKKVEELTLYLIEENKKLKEQNKQLEQQNSRLEQQQQEIDELKKLIREKK